MPIKIRLEYLIELRERYQKSTKGQKTLILNEFCQFCKYQRKYAIRILRGKVTPRVQKPGPKPKYRGEVVKALTELWHLMNQMCSKKMVVALPLWLPHYKAPEHVQNLLVQMSAATIDRLLKPHRAHLQHGLSTTRASFFKNKIPIKLLDHDILMPGYIEADTVAHCGTSVEGSYANTLTMTDLFSGWTDNRAIWTKQAEPTSKKIKSIEERLPFSLIGFACDNGTELNEILLNYFSNRQAPVKFVRRRPYKKNDNAHVEQKNWTHVRQLFGYDRFDNPELIPLMNEIYQAYWNPLWNFFTPSMKLAKKERIGGFVKKFYDKPKTPYERLMESTYVPEKEKANLRDQFHTKNPIYLKKQLDLKIQEFFSLADKYKQLKKTTGS